MISSGWQAISGLQVGVRNSGRDHAITHVVDLRAVNDHRPAGNHRRHCSDSRERQGESLCEFVDV